MEDNLYAYTIWFDEGNPAKDIVWASNLKEAINKIDNEYGLDENCKDIEIERLRKVN